MKVEPKAGKPADTKASHERPSRHESRDQRSKANGVIRDVERSLRDGKLSKREGERIERRLERDRNLTPAQRQLASSLIDKATSDGKFSHSEKDALRQLFRSEPTSAQKDTLSRFLDRAFKDEKLDRSESRAFENLLKNEGGVDEKLTSSVLDRLQKDGRLSRNESKLLDRVLHGEVDGERRFLRNLDRAYRDGRLSDRELRQLSRQIDPVERLSARIEDRQPGPQRPQWRNIEGRIEGSQPGPQRPRSLNIDGRIEGAVERFRTGRSSHSVNENAYRAIHEIPGSGPASRSIIDATAQRFLRQGSHRWDIP